MLTATRNERIDNYSPTDNPQLPGKIPADCHNVGPVDQRILRRDRVKPVYIFLLFWFQLFNGFSGSNAIDQLSQILFSITFTGLPSLLMGIWDNPIDADTLLANPVLYRAGIQGRIVFHLVGLIASYLVLWVFFTMIYHSVAVVGISPESPYRVIFMAMNDGPFWLLTLVTTVTALLLLITLKNTFHPSWDTIAGLLAKRYGYGKRLPLEPYIFGTFAQIPVSPKLTPTHELSRTESVRTTPSRITPRDSVDAADRAAYGSHISISSVIEGTEPTEQTAQFMSRMGQLFTVSGRLLRGVPPSPTLQGPEDSTLNTIRLNPSRDSPLSMVNLRTGPSHVAIDLRRRRRHTQTIHHTHTPRHLRHLGLGSSNNFDDDAGRPVNPVIWPAVNPNVRVHSFSSRHYSTSRSRPDMMEIIHHNQASSLPLNTTNVEHAFRPNPYPSSDAYTPPSGWAEQSYRAQWFYTPEHPVLDRGLFDPPPPYSLDDLPDPQERSRPSDTSYRAQQSRVVDARGHSSTSPSPSSSSDTGAR
ncbi:unnamed protein product [Echinostoma caproni]|uniref:PhoLip_ATPase_C domain-containing protein n=1 Tax=Echinostoma caproni TaxID=27848 RepID=A0A183AGT4_9TREM|nr:unnamed protein product [Echinostoma caproni]